MRAIAVIGGTGRGKSHFIKNDLLAKINVTPIIYDVNNEYYQGQDYELPDMETFVDYVKTKPNNLIVFEEASIFFKHHSKIAKTVENLLIRKRHTKQFFVFVFHGLHQIPTNIIDYITTFVLFKTDENPELVYKKFSGYTRIIDNFDEVKQSNDFHFKKIF